MMNPNPTCEGNCSFTFFGRVSTAMVYYPTYDKDGNETSKDPNYHYQKVRCKTCHRNWNIRQHMGETIITDL